MSEAKIDEFPCLFSASRVIGVSETGSLETASSSGESANFRSLSGRRYPAAARSARPRLALDAARFEFLVQQPDHGLELPRTSERSGRIESVRHFAPRTGLRFRLPPVLRARTAVTNWRRFSIASIGYSPLTPSARV